MTTEYEALDLAEVQNEYARVSAEPGNFGGDDFLEKFVRLPERDGYTLMRILPRKKGSKFYVGTRVHTLNDPSQRDNFGKPRKRTFHCPKTLVQTEKGPRWQGECIICKYYTDLWQKSEGLSGKAQEDLQNQARNIKPVERYYYNVIVRSEKDKEGVVQKNVGPKIYSCGKTVHAKIMRAIVGDETAGEKSLGDVTHPITGRDFRVVKKVVKGGGGTEYPNYDNSKFEDASPLGSPDELSTWVENLHDLVALRALKSTEELRQALRVHLGMVTVSSDSTEDHDLDEFRGVGQSSSSTISASSEAVREELTVPKTNAPAHVAEAEEDLLADDDFMKELGDM